MSVGNNSGLLKWTPSPPDYDTSVKLRAVSFLNFVPEFLIIII